MGRDIYMQSNEVTKIRGCNHHQQSHFGIEYDGHSSTVETMTESAFTPWAGVKPRTFDPKPGLSPFPRHPRRGRIEQLKDIVYQPILLQKAS
jgi:hypothetical protein